MEVTINKVHMTAETVYLNHPEASYGIFCFNSVGDLFLNSDYGMYGYAWRAYGDDFKSFLSQCNSEYVVSKFETNYRQMSTKKLNKTCRENLLILVDAFIDHLKSVKP